MWSEATSRFGRHLRENVSFAHGRIDGSIGEVARADLRWVPNLFARRVSVAPCWQGEYVMISCRCHDLLYIKLCAFAKVMHWARLNKWSLFACYLSQGYLRVIVPQVELVFRFSHLVVYFYQIWWECCKFDLVKSLLELHLDFRNFLRLLLLFCLEIEVVYVLRVKWLYPFWDNETLLEQLHLFILAVILRLVTRI